MDVKLPIDPRTMPDGTILVFHIRYLDEGGAPAGPTYSYVLSKVAGSWYGTGTGRVPQAAGWRAVENWLDDPRRKVERVELVTSQQTIWPPEARPESLIEIVTG